jgi:hypothetical protein
MNSIKSPHLVLQRLTFAGLIGLALLQLFIVLLDHYYYRTYALDYAIYNFAFYDFAHARLSPVPAYIFPFPSHFLQDHFSLTLIFLSPLYWVLTPVLGTYTLLVIQWCFIVWGAWGTYSFLKQRSGNVLIGYAAVVYYFILFGRYSAYRGDVNLAIMGASVVPVFLYFVEARRWRAAVIVFALLLLNREDMSLWLFFSCLFLLIVYRKDKSNRTRLVYLLLASVIYFLIVMYAIIPAFEDENRKYALFSFTAVGETPAQALKFMFLHPIKAVELLFINHSGVDYQNGIKANFYWVYMVSGGFVLIARPWFVLPLIPLLLKKMYDDNPLRWSIEYYYSIEFVSILPILIFWIIADLPWRRVRVLLIGAVVLLTASMTVYKMLVPPPNPLVGESNKYNFVSPSFYHPDYSIHEVQFVLSKIPLEAKVCATGRLLSHLAYREKVYYFPRINDAEYVAILKREDWYPLFPDQFDAEILQLRNNPSWTVLEEKQDVLLFKRKAR